MYRVLKKFLPEKLANITMIVWYFLLLLLIYLFSVKADAGFIYLYL